MRNHKTPISLTIFTCCLAALITWASPQGTGRGVVPDGAQREAESRTASPQAGVDREAEFKSQFPMAAYDAPAPADPDVREKRRKKGKKYDKAIIPLEEDEDADTITSTIDWAVELPALPVAQSRAVVVGRVTNAEAFLSADKTSVYSEFTIAVDEVLKDDGSAPLVAEGTVTAERSGGRVRFPSGRVTLQLVQGQGMPRVGRQYVLFLRRHDDEPNVSILTGYELKAGRVQLLDNPAGGTHPIAKYQGAEQSDFIRELKSLIAGRSER